MLRKKLNKIIRKDAVCGDKMFESKISTAHKLYISLVEKHCTCDRNNSVRFMIYLWDGWCCPQSVYAVQIPLDVKFKCRCPSWNCQRSRLCPETASACQMAPSCSSSSRFIQVIGWFTTLQIPVFQQYSRFTFYLHWADAFDRAVAIRWTIVVLFRGVVRIRTQVAAHAAFRPRKAQRR